MNDTVGAPFTPISEDDLLAYSHLQALAQLQDEIRSLRSAIPALLTPLLRAPSTSSITPSSNPPTGSAAKSTTDAVSIKSNEPQNEFREQAIKVQKDVKLLVNNLEKMCETLEAAEKVRSEDYNERGELIAQDPLLRTDVIKDMSPTIANESVGVANQGGSGMNGEQDASTQLSDGPPPPPPSQTQTQALAQTHTNGQLEVQPALANAEYLFNGADGIHVPDGMGDANINLDVFDTSLYNEFGLDAYSNDWSAFNTDDMIPPS